MRISSINSLSKIKNYSENNKINTEKPVQTESKTFGQYLSNIYYPPIGILKLNNTNKSDINFNSRKARTFSTDKRKLAEKSGDFYIARFSDIPCPACGKKMLNLNKYNAIADELSTLEPDEYLDCIGKYKEYMRPVEESVYDEILELSKKSGTKDIRTLLVKLREKKLPLLQKQQLKTVNKMRALARTLPKDEQIVLNNKIKALVGLIRKTNSEAPFRRKIVLDRISKIKIRNHHKYDKLQRIAKTFPTSADINSAWIVKYSGKNKYNDDWKSFDIAKRFFSSSVANTDHIIAYGIENNHDDISNYLAMHSACNSQKGNKSFLQWLYEDKANRITHLREYFDVIDDMIKSKRIKKKKYRNYVAHATQTIFEASKGQLKLFGDGEIPPL
ncbi:hypothetical protein IJ182_00555 [bacterium]|nr:hypothetical protein [bacterium]